MFSASAEFYDLLYSTFKDYDAESARVAALIRAHAPRARTVLDVACGTGEHAWRLAGQHGFHVDALDLDPGFVGIARKKLTHGTVFQADMTNFDLGRRYDAILCLFSSIGYVRTLENVRRTFACFRRHLAERGIVVVEPWFPPGVLESGHVTVKTAEGGGVAVARVSRTEIEGRLSRIYFEYLIGRSTGIERASEVHELGLFTTQEMLGCFRDAGLAAEHDPAGLDDRGLYIARDA